MTCIFDFGTHDFCPCYLLNVEEPELSEVVICDCKHRLRCQFERSTWDDNFDTFVDCCIDDRLHEICETYPGSCGNELTDEEASIVSKKFEKICDANMTYG